MKKLLLDINIFLDIFLERKDFLASSSRIFELVEISKYKGFISSSSFPTLFYIISKENNRNEALLNLEKIRAIFKVAEVNERIIDLALVSGFPDFEDAIQYYSALNKRVDFLITRNTKDFKKNDIPILTPDEFISQNLS